jgi:hypothetical protein
MTEMESTLFTKARRVKLAAGLLVIPLSLAACSQGGSDDADVASSGPRVSATTPIGQPDHVVQLDGALTRIYSAPTVEAFTQDPAVTNVIQGKVTNSRPQVTQPGNVVETILTIDVSAQRESGAPTTVQVREQGGVVTMADVSSDFVARLGRKLTSKEMSQTVDYRFNAIRHAAVGDEVLIAVGPDDASRAPNAYVSLARLEASAPDSAGRSGASTFAWPGESPNAAWAPVVDASALLR